MTSWYALIHPSVQQPRCVLRMTRLLGIGGGGDAFAVEIDVPVAASQSTLAS